MVAVVAAVVVVGRGRGLLTAGGRATLGRGRVTMPVRVAVTVDGVVVGLVLVVPLALALALALAVGLVELVEHLLGLLHNLEQKRLGRELGVGRARRVENLVRGLDAHEAQLDLRVDQVQLVLGAAAAAAAARLLALGVGHVGVVPGVVPAMVAVVAVVAMVAVVRRGGRGLGHLSARGRAGRRG